MRVRSTRMMGLRRNLGRTPATPGKSSPSRESATGCPGATGRTKRGHEQGILTGQLGRLRSGQLRQWSAAGTPFLLHTVTAPVSGPASARSRVAVSMGSAPAAVRKFRRPRDVSQTINRGRGRPDAAIRR